MSMETILIGLLLGSLLALAVAYLQRVRHPHWVRRFVVFTTTFDGAWLALYVLQHRSS